LTGETKDDLQTGGRGEDTLRGNGGEDTLRGGAGDDALFGDGSNDDLYPGAGNDQINTGSGADDIILRPGGGADEVTDFTPGSDDLDLRAFGIGSFSTLESSYSPVGVSGGTLIDLGGGDTILLDGVSPGALAASDFIL